MKLSIIIPVFNSSKILEKLINEINSNLYETFKNDYEIILVNDFSNDNSWEKIKKISEKIRNEELSIEDQSLLDFLYDLTIEKIKIDNPKYLKE